MPLPEDGPVSAAHSTTATPRPPVTASKVMPRWGLPRGRTAHEAAVGALLASYAAIPPGANVRLAKRTSNLFRTRGASGASVGLDVSGLDGVISLDPDAGTADVQGMCTYEDLVAVTLPKGFMPYVVPQLRTITLGGAVTGLGIESTSFRNGLPHESVLEMDILTGSGQIVTARPRGEHADLFRAFPNSYGTLGYSVRLRIALERVRPYVRLRNVRFDTLEALQDAIATVVAHRSWEGVGVDFCDGVVFSPQESYLVLGAWADEVPAVSDYTGGAIYYQSLRERGHDALTIHDYLWRWDTDWFWCSKAFAAQVPWVRRIWPAGLRRSDVYHRIVGLETRFGVMRRIDAARGKPARERVIQDIEVPVDRTAQFVSWFSDHVGMTPVWLCPLAVRQHGGPLGDVPDGSQPWPLYPLKAGQTYVNVGFWGTVPIENGRADGDVNRAIEAEVSTLGGHKSLYSDAYYTPEEFWQRYGGAAYSAVKGRYDPDQRFLDLYAKAVGRR